jgi:hypothetical protein
MGKNNIHTSVGWLSGVWTQTASFTNFECVTIGVLVKPPRLKWSTDRPVHKFWISTIRRLGMRVVPRLCIIFGPGICVTTEEKSRKNSVRAHERCSAYQCPARFVWSTCRLVKRWPRTAYWPPPPLAFASGGGPTLGQRRYLPSGPMASRSTAARLLRWWVRFPPGIWMFVCCVCCVLSGIGLCDELITRPEKSSRMWRVVVYDQETSWTRSP